MSAVEKVRTFLCVEIPGKVRDHIEHLQHQLAELRADVGWVKKSNFHLTLKFLGHISTAQVAEVCEIVQQVASGNRAFYLELKETGCFPNERRPRILWVGLAEVPSSFRELYHSIDLPLSKIGFPSEARPFQPHLTIGRVRSDRNTALMVQALKMAGFHSEPFLVSEVLLMRSELKRSGAVYSPLQKFPLRTESLSTLDSAQTI